jgi:hypothetical protein
MHIIRSHKTFESEDIDLPTVHCFETERKTKMKIGYDLRINNYEYKSRDKWVPVTTTWRVLRLRMEERPPIWRMAANILNK